MSRVLSAGTPDDYLNIRGKIDRLAVLLADRRAVVLTGAGVSTASGIPDYRGPDSPPRTPMTYQQFVADPDFRRHYWARNHIGWRHMDAAVPNVAHRRLAELERAGVVSAVITQNVDLLHTKAGSRSVIDLHGSYAQVICLGCGWRMSRHALAERLERLNPGYVESVSGPRGVEIAPDADAEVVDSAHFRMVNCQRCGGILKPHIVYFGESVPPDRVAAAYELVENAGALVVLGSSLTVMSGLRFVRRAAKLAIPVAIVNRGTTRGDDLAAIKLDTGCSEVLAGLSDQLGSSPGQ